MVNLPRRQVAGVAGGIGIWLYDGGNFDEVGLLEEHTRTLNAVAFSPDGKTLASGGCDRTVRLWDVAGQKQVGVMREPALWAVGSVAFSSDGKTLASIAY